ncbi:hypothetical protein [Bacillus sp. T33-2]|uniref:hypothetical protein n=1 Tax=Bacillus sp. T33-2 TaxID=2054168 RepID=UPI000C788DEA|nr:hypothetical protein [Bacillus sp. T33-2]PLR95864.1 hypothetical protein CVD19_12590 [Bacillus sp. T33-2]
MTEQAPATTNGTVVAETVVPAVPAASAKASPSATAAAKSVVGQEHSANGKAKAAEQVKAPVTNKPVQPAVQPVKAQETKKPEQQPAAQQVKAQETQKPEQTNEKGNSESNGKGGK